MSVYTQKKALNEECLGKNSPETIIINFPIMHQVITPQVPVKFSRLPNILLRKQNKGLYNQVIMFKSIHHQNSAAIDLLIKTLELLLYNSESLALLIVQGCYTLSRRAFVIFFIFVAIDMSMRLSPISITMPPITVGST